MVGYDGGNRGLRRTEAKEGTRPVPWGTNTRWPGLRARGNSASCTLAWLSGQVRAELLGTWISRAKSWLFVHYRPQNILLSKYGRRKRHNLCITLAPDTLLTWWSFSFLRVSVLSLSLSSCFFFLNYCNEYKKASSLQKLHLNPNYIKRINSYWTDVCSRKLCGKQRFQQHLEQWKRCGFLEKRKTGRELPIYENWKPRFW